MCVVVNGRFVNGPSVDVLCRSAQQAADDGADALFLTDGPLGDAIVLASALALLLTGECQDLLLGVCVNLEEEPHRHPTLLAREMSTFDLVSGGRAALAFREPFTDGTEEAVDLCRDMWRQGVAASTKPNYPVAGAINRPLPLRPGGPPIALDLTAGARVPEALLSACDFVLVSSGGPAPASLPPGVTVCHMQDP